MQQQQKAYDKALLGLYQAQIDLIKCFPVGSTVFWYIRRNNQCYRQDGIVLAQDTTHKNVLAYHREPGTPLISPPHTDLIKVKNTKTGSEKWLSYFELLPFMGVSSDYWNGQKTQGKLST